MTCHDARDQLSALLDDALGADERGAVERHLAGCADCQRELERLRGTIALLRRLEPARAPVGFVDEVLRATRPWYRRVLDAAFVPLSTKLPLELAAAAMIAVLGFQLVRDVPALRVAVTVRGDPPPAEQPPSGALTDTREPAGSAPVEQPRPSTPTSEPGPPSPPAGSGDQAESSQEARRMARSRPLLGDSASLPQDPAAGEGGRAAPTAGPVASRPGPGTTAESDPASKALAAPPPVSARPAPSSPEALRRTLPAAVLERGPSGSESTSLPTSSPATAAAPAFRAAEPAALTPDCCVRGTLAAADKTRAVSQVVELATRLGGTEVARRADADRIAIDITVSRGAYPAFVDGLRRLGRFTVERTPVQFPAAVRVGIDIVQ